MDLTTLINLRKVIIDCVSCNPKQLCHSLLRELNSFNEVVIEINPHTIAVNIYSRFTA